MVGRDRGWAACQDGVQPRCRNGCTKAVLQVAVQRYGQGLWIVEPMIGGGRSSKCGQTCNSTVRILGYPAVDIPIPPGHPTPKRKLGTGSKEAGLGLNLAVVLVYDSRATSKKSKTLMS